MDKKRLAHDAKLEGECVQLRVDIAKQLRAFYDGLRAEGFDDEQAMYLTSDLLQQLRKKS